MTDSKPKWNRRKQARPTEIIEAAMHVFIEHGFAATKLTDVAKRAGIVKGTLYRYYETKQDLFRAVVQHAVSVNIKEIKIPTEALQGSLVVLVTDLLVRVAEKMSQSHIPALALLVISESRNFPDLANIWHDNVVAKVLSMLTDLITKAQKRGEIRLGDPKAYAFSIVGPMVMGVLFQQVLGTERGNLPDLKILAKQHAETILRGLVIKLA